MANEQEQIELLYDPKPFLNGISQSIDSLTKFQETLVNIQKQINESMQPPKKKTFFEKFMGLFKKTDEQKKIIEEKRKKRDEKRRKKEDERRKEASKKEAKITKGLPSQLAFLGKLGIIGGILALAYKAINKIINQVPEVGMTFSRVGDIILKNLFFPLRLWLIPILQKILNWARENRGMFLKWGSVVLNIGKAIGVVIGKAVEIIVMLAKKATNILQILTGTTGQDIIQTINVFIFKFVALFLFIETKVSWLFNFIGDMVVEITKSIAEFVGSFVKGFLKIDGVNEAWDKFFQTVTKIYSLIGKLVALLVEKFAPSMEQINGLFEGLGEIAGIVLKFIVEKITELGEGIAFLLESLISLIEETPTKKSPVKKPIRKVEDAIIKPDGSVIETNPLDTLVALKNPTKSLTTVNKSSTVKDIIINNYFSSNDKNTVDISRKISTDLSKIIRQNILDEYTLEGAR